MSRGQSAGLLEVDIPILGDGIICLPSQGDELFLDWGCHCTAGHLSGGKEAQLRLRVLWGRRTEGLSELIEPANPWGAATERIVNEGEHREC